MLEVDGDLELAQPSSSDAGAGADDAGAQRESQGKRIRSSPPVERVLLDSDANADALGAHAGRPSRRDPQLRGVDVDDREVQPRDPQIGNGHADLLGAPGGEARSDRDTKANRGTDAETDEEVGDGGRGPSGDADQARSGLRRCQSSSSARSSGRLATSGKRASSRLRSGFTTLIRERSAKRVMTRNTTSSG